MLYLGGRGLTPPHATGNLTPAWAATEGLSFGAGGVSTSTTPCAARSGGVDVTLRVRSDVALRTAALRVREDPNFAYVSHVARRGGARTCCKDQ